MTMPRLFVPKQSTARIAQLVRALDMKTRGCGFDYWAGQPNNY